MIKTEPTSVRKSLRPLLIASRRSLAEHSMFLRYLLLGLADESVAAALVCPASCDVACLAPMPVSVFRHPFVDLPLMERVGVGYLSGQLERFRPTVLHCLCESRAALTRRLARRLDLPYILMVNSLVRRFHQLSISPRRCMRMVVPAETLRLGAVKGHPRLADRVRNVNVGTFAEPEVLCFADPSRLPGIVVAHRLDRVSDFEALLSAVRALLDEGYELAMVIMGSGAAEHALRQRVAALGLAEAVTMVPTLHPWRSVLAAGDIFVQPQPAAAFSYFALEAMSLGMAVVACEGGGDDLMVADKTALLVQPNDESTLRGTLARLLDAHDFARRLAAMAQEYVRINHSVSAMVSATLNLYMDAQREYGC